MHPLHEAACAVVDDLTSARMLVAKLAADLAETEHAFRVSNAKAERALIK